MNIDFRFILSNKELQSIPLFEGEELLEKLDLSHNTIKKLENLISLPKLNYLNLSYNKITMMTNMNTLQQLKFLDLSHNYISIIEGLDYLKSLETLNLDSNCILRIAGLSHLVKLTILKLNQNKISLLDGINTLLGLKELYIARNQITDMGKIDTLRQLEIVDVSYNNIEKYELTGRLKLLKTFKNEHKPCTEAPVEPPAAPSSLENVSNTLNCVKNIVKPPEENDYTPEQVKLIEKIKNEWKFEQLSEKASETFLAVIENGTTLHLFGVSALDYLTTTEYKSKITEIIFECIKFEHVVYPPVLAELKKYNLLTSLVLINNGLSSFVLLSKLEPLNQVKKLSVKQNEICKLVTFEAFVAYRFQHLTELNRKSISKELRGIAKDQFERFDRALPAATLANKRHLCYKKLGYSKAAIKAFAKDCELASHQFCKKVKTESENCYEERRTAKNNINYFVSDIIQEYTEKLQKGIAIDEDSLNLFK